MGADRSSLRLSARREQGEPGRGDAVTVSLTGEVVFYSPDASAPRSTAGAYCGLREVLRGLGKTDHRRTAIQRDLYGVGDLAMVRLAAPFSYHLFSGG